MKRLRRILLYSCLSLVGLGLLAPVSFRLWLKYEYHLPPEQRVRKQFENNRADYIQFVTLLQVTLLQRDQSAHVIDGGGRVDAPWGWEQTAVTSLDSAKLPQEHGAVATGLYVVPIEPEWFIYRLEYRE